jgi:hypothetical protein
MPFQKSELSAWRGRSYAFTVKASARASVLAVFLFTEKVHRLSLSHRLTVGVMAGTNKRKENFGRRGKVFIPCRIFEA